jgi:hypothetical protein
MNSTSYVIYKLVVILAFHFGFNYSMLKTNTMHVRSSYIGSDMQWGCDTKFRTEQWLI